MSESEQFQKYVKKLKLAKDKSEVDAILEEFTDFLLSHGWKYGGIIRSVGPLTPEQLLNHIQEEAEMLKRVKKLR